MASSGPPLLPSLEPTQLRSPQLISFNSPEFRSFQLISCHLIAELLISVSLTSSRNSIYWTLFFVFIAGTVESNLLYLGYLIFALIYLYSTNRIYKYRNSHWKWARIYNIVVIFFRV